MLSSASAAFSVLRGNRVESAPLAEALNLFSFSSLDRPRHRSRHGTADPVMSEKSGDSSSSTAASTTTTILSISDAIKHKRNSSGGRMEGAGKSGQSQRSRGVTDDDDEGVWHTGSGAMEANSTDDVSGANGGKGDSKHRRARSLIKMLGNSFTKSEVCDSLTDLRTVFVGLSYLCFSLELPFS